MADLVAAGLARPGAIAVDFGLDILERRSVGAGEPLDGVIARPALGVQAGVDDQAAAAIGDRLEIAQPPGNIAVIGAQFVAQLLGIERPALAIGVEGQQRPDQRQFIRIFALPDMAGNALMITEGGQAVARPDAGIAQVDIIIARHAAVDRPGAGIGARRTRLDLHRHALDDQFGGHQRREGARQARADVGQAAVDIGQDLRPPRIIIGEEVARVLAHGGHAFAHRALAHAQPLEQAVHFGLERGELVEAKGVHLVRGHARGRAGAQRPGVIFLALRQLPHARVHRRGGAVTLKLGDLASERGGDLVPHDRRGAGGVIARHVLGAARDRRDRHPLIDGLALHPRHLRQRLVEQEGGCDHADARVVAKPLRFAVQIGGIGLQPRQIGVGIGAILDFVVGIEEIGRFDEAAGILRHRIGAVAIGPVAVHHRHVAEGEGKAVRRQFMGRAHHFHIGAGRGRKRIELDRAQAGQPVAHMGGDPRLAGRALVAQSRLERGARAYVDAKAAGGFGRIGEHGFGHLRQERFGAGIGPIGGPSGGPRGGQRPGGQGGQGKGGSTGGKQVAASGGHGKASLRQGWSRSALAQSPGNSTAYLPLCVIRALRPPMRPCRSASSGAAAAASSALAGRWKRRRRQRPGR